MSWSAIDLASLTGMAKPMPMLPPCPLPPPPSWAIELLMPMSRPSASTRAPPEFPGLIAAEVWMAFVTTGSAEPWLPKGESAD